MNRRLFLKSLALAPVAAPVIAQQAAAPAFASGGYVSGLSSYSFSGIDWGGMRLSSWTVDDPQPIDAIARLSQSFDAVPVTVYRAEAALSNAGKAITKVVDLVAKFPSDIEAQMRADDLFDSDARVMAPADDPVPLSPEPKETNRQTA